MGGRIGREGVSAGVLIALWDVERPVVHVYAEYVDEVPEVGAVYELAADDAGSMRGSWTVLSHEPGDPVYRAGRRVVRVNVIRTERLR